MMGLIRDAQFAGSSSVPAHVEMMGLIGMGNNPMVGATVACAVAVEENVGKSSLEELKAEVDKIDIVGKFSE